jgi:hypothetical protein
MRYLSKLTKRLSLLRSPLVVGTLALAACTDAGGPTALSPDLDGSSTLTSSSAYSVSVSPRDAALVVGDTLRISAIVRDRRGRRLNKAGVTWSSTQPSVAGVSSSGRVTALSAGSANIIATSGGVSANVAVTVAALPAPTPASEPAPTPEPAPEPTPEPTPESTPESTPTSNIFFSSDWSTATGNSDQAITDGGTWNSVYCSGRNTTLSVVPGSTVGFSRSANVLRLQQLGTTCGMLERLNAIPLSTSHYGRMYFRNDETTSRHNHVMSYFPVGAIQSAVWNRSGTATGVNIRFRTYYAANGAASVYPHAHWLLGNGSREIELAHGTWYRYEWHMEFLTPTTYRLWPRIYTADGTEPLYDYRDFYGGDFTVSLAQFYASGGSFGFSDVSMARHFGIGNEGPASGTNSGQYWYHAGVALGTGGWIGR